MDGPKGVDRQKDEMKNKIAYYLEHPELEPPIMMKNLVGMLQKMKSWDATNYNPDFFSDEDEDLLMEEEKQTTTPPENIVVSPAGIRLENIFITDRMLNCTDIVQIDDVHGCRMLRFISSSDQVFTYPDIPLPKYYTDTQLFKAIEQWKIENWG
jgi:hypothetical protein